MKAGMQKSRKLPDFVVRPAEAHASIFSRKLLLAPSNAQNFLSARPPLGSRGPTAQIWDPLSERTPPPSDPVRGTLVIGAVRHRFVGSARLAAFLKRHAAYARG